MASFQAKTGWESPRMSEIKIIVPISTNLTRYKELKNNEQKIQKIKKHHYGFFSSQNMLGKTEKEGKKIIVPISSYPTWNREFQKKYQENSKN